MLGLTPTAASDEIARAFARQTSVFRPHVFGGIAEACIAFATLRDPIKRRAYDASIGIKPEPDLRAPPKPREEPSFARPVSPYRVERSAINTAVPPASPVNPEPRAEPAAERTQLFNTVLLGAPVDQNVRASSPAPVPEPELRHRQETETKPRVAPQIGGALSRQLALEERFGVEASPIDWRRTGMAAGAVVVAACFLGAFAGWWSAGDISTTPQTESEVSVPLPPAKPLAALNAPQPIPPVSAMEARPEGTKRTAVAAARIERAPIVSQLAGADEPPQEGQSQESQPEQGGLDTSSSEQPAATAPLASTVAASMPLPNRVIARTIERIGYSCGAVASTSPVEGEAPGVYKITCASGQSYQARPVNGRYRFRRWGRN
jgi:hypothetical protein